MIGLDPNANNLAKKVKQYQEVLQNTEAYRALWQSQLRDIILTELKAMCAEVGLACKIECKGETNLEAIVLSMGIVHSGLSEEIAEEILRPLIKNNGSLIYQQLFNGKIMVVVQLPYIEKYGQPTAPKQIAIYRPEELKTPYFFRHLETFIEDLTRWEDFDDDNTPPDANHAIGFKMNFEPPNVENASK